MIDMTIRNKKDMETFYKKALKKILSFKASELSTVEFEQVKRNAKKLPIYRFVRRNNGKRKGIRDRVSKSLGYVGLASNKKQVRNER